MKIAAIGEAKRIRELRNRISSKHQFVEVKNNNFNAVDVVFDLNFDEGGTTLDSYSALKGVPVILCAVHRSLEEMVQLFGKEISCHLFGINSLPTFIDRNKLEMTSLKEGDRWIVDEMSTQLGVDVTWVKSRVGMVTPRVVCMIINEAYYTFQEGTATKEDIDTGMKLGTAYPYGPFEWSERIGISNVYSVLKALYLDTGEERYKMCPGLKTAHLEAVAMGF